MPKDATPQRQRLLACAARLFETQGYAATGLSQLLTESGTPKGSLYHYFPNGKESLAVAVIEHAAQEVELAISHLMANHATPLDSLQAVLALFRQKLIAADFKAGCPIATIALEQADHSEPIRLACAAAYARWQTLLTERLGGDAAATQQAQRILMLLEGALLLARVNRSLTPLVQLDTLLPHLLDLSNP